VKRILISAVAGIALMVAVSACTTEDLSKGAIMTYFPEQFDKALSVATCESGLDPAAVSPGGGNWGLFQINLVHADLVGSLGYQWGELTNPYVNAHVARVIYDSSGWGAWACG
jgi:lysozyme-like protein